ncbi:MAG: hypothetical protein KJO08_01580, partial [Gammaproteobacteria bacterium]|nr:hypothetical protein [Gammaproteobacteria bacterium]NNJ84042.1 hypothetical protein [Gammaproteobacteria bacterium]
YIPLPQSGFRADGSDDVETPDEFLDHLKQQVALLEFYYGSDKQNDALGRALTSGGSELARVIAWQRGESAPLTLWQHTQPGSYAIRLLSAWRGDDTNPGDFPLDREMLKRLAREFPELHRRHDWLRFPFLSPEEREKIVAAARKDAGAEFKEESTPNHALWGGRLTDIYPDIDEPEKPQKVSTDIKAVRKLVADIALASTDRAVGGVALVE